MSEVTRVELAPGYHVPRIITGAWQLSEGHTPEPLAREAVFATFDALVEYGFTAFDCADIYTGVEQLLGEFLRRQPPSQRQRIQIHTKFVPDRDALPRMDRAYVARVIDRSLHRLGVERLDLVQFSWWDYDVPGYVETAGWLSELQAAGKIGLLGATNFDVERFEEICAAGVGLIANQVQYSPLDTRPENGMIDACARQQAWLLCYGALAGGFLSDAHMGLAVAPHPPANRSLTKYGLIIDDFGGWDLYQDLLVALASIARKHGVSISSVALRWVLQQPCVAAALVGVSRRDRVAQNLSVFSLRLDADDLVHIDAVLERRTGPYGDVFESEREPGGKHAAIMRYDLNR
jgi:aryl-alcohol dehydrogenase-like predicted oxidoreductase